MNLQTYPKYHCSQINMITNCLVNEFLKPLYDSLNERNYFAYVGCCAEIVEWAHEFHTKYCPKLNDWESFKKSGDNIYNSSNPDDFLVAWGYDRIKQFIIQHKEQNIEIEKNKFFYHMKRTDR